jgi:hypothetical protein
VDVKWILTQVEPPVAGCGAFWCVMLLRFIALIDEVGVKWNVACTVGVLPGTLRVF